ncbi:MAG: thioredoxin family protein [Flavobacteriaceae bacterium]|nr:thioredoxin family protein [Flavobacteriaceae bacterium]
MKKVFLLLAVFVSFFTSAQIAEPVKWATQVEKISDTEYNLVSVATIDDGWHLYSQNIAEGGPVATTFTYDAKGGVFSTVGKTTEPKGHTVQDKAFNMEVTYFGEKAIFKQKVQFKEKPTLQNVNGTVEFMCCNDGQCLPPTEVDLLFDLSKAKAVSADNSAVQKNATEDRKEVAKVAKKDTDTKKRGLLTIFFIAFLSGFAALLTPCVFPMIPMTVSFFTKQSKTRAEGIKNATIYGLSIVIIYVLLGSGVTAIFGADSLNALSTNVWFNLIFFVILVIFSVSFLGAFELTLPSSWGTKVDAQADRGGLIGIFFMALALAIVSFSCTGPIVGTLLVESASKGGIAPIVGMLGFSLAIALPFALFAAFPGWLNSLPKSGGWLNTVKVFLGFLELALAFKFLSNADLVLQTHLLEREVFLAIWIAVFGTLALYLFGKIKLPHDSPLDHISVGRLSMGMFVLMFTIYLIPGLWGAPLKIISGFPPPMKYSEAPHGVGYMKTGGGASKVANVSLPEGAEFGEYDIVMFHNYDEGLAYAKKVGKPVLLDFTGHACINCRKMEQFVWNDEKVLPILKDKVVFVSLHVDDKRPLKESEIVDSKLKPGKKLKYIGQKWSELQTIRYKRNTQPLYVLMAHNEENLIEPQAYTSDANEFYNWLKEGVANFKK